MHPNESVPASNPRVKSASPPHTSSWLSLPGPIRAVFNQFPIITYAENNLPQRASSSKSLHTLHVFTSHGTEFSPNPACLKWQLYLMIQKIPFAIHSSNNHASPTGALPFLLPATISKRDPLPQAISATKIQRWAETQGAGEATLDLNLEAYMALLDQNIRNAWLFHLYLRPDNFNSIARTLYVDPTSSNTFVQATLARQLRTAAQDQLLRTRSFIDGDEIYDQVDAAFTALSTLLGDQDFFSKSKAPGLFDVSLVAYTHLILDFQHEHSQQPLRWSDETLPVILLRHHTLVAHRDRTMNFANETGSG